MFQYHPTPTTPVVSITWAKDWPALLPDGTAYHCVQHGYARWITDSEANGWNDAVASTPKPDGNETDGGDSSDAGTTGAGDDTKPAGAKKAGTKAK